MTFDECKEFCLEWGFNVVEDRDNDLPYSVYPKMRQDAEDRYGEKFAKFMSRNTDTTDNHTYVCANSWDELEEAFDEFMASQ